MAVTNFSDEVRASRLLSVREIGRSSGSDMDLGSDSDELLRRISSPVNPRDRNQCSKSNSVSSSSQSEAESNQLPTQLGLNQSLKGHHLPIFHTSGLGPWYAVVAYDACVRLCLNSWSKGCEQSVSFLNNECKLLREAFSLRSTLLQSEEEVLSKQASELVSLGAAPRPSRAISKIKVQVRKVKVFPEPSSGCRLPHLPKISLKSLQDRVSCVGNRSSSKEGCEYVQIGKKKRLSFFSVQYQKMFVRLSEPYFCMMRLKSSDEDDMVRMQAGADHTYIFFPDTHGDDLEITVQDSKGRCCGRALAHIDPIARVMQAERVSWWPIYGEQDDDEAIGKIQLYISYSTVQDEGKHIKCGIVTEAVAYDVVLETAMKAQGFQPRNLELVGPWKWLVAEFAAFFGISDAYTKLRFLSYVMEIATPTPDCLSLLHDSLCSIISCGSKTTTLSHQEDRILGEVLEKLEQVLSLVFENYKSLDESSPSGLSDGFGPPTGLAAPALAPAVKLYTLIHDVLSAEPQLRLCKHFQAAARKRSKMHLRGSIDHSNTITTAYMEMKSLCLTIKEEIRTDVEIHNQDVLPSFLDLPSITSSIYSMELQSRLCAFLKSYPPNGPSPNAIDLVATVADFQKDLSSWNIKPLKGGVDPRGLFGSMIPSWIKETRLALLGLCVKEKACHTTKWPDVRVQTRTSPFVEDMYVQLKDTLNVYEPIVSRFPSYAVPFEKAIADVENAVIAALDRHYADVLSPIKENGSRFGFKSVQRLTKKAEGGYIVPAEVGVLMNSIRRMIDVLWPKIELQVKSWSSYDRTAVLGESLGEAMVVLRAKFRSYLQLIIEKIFNNTRASNATRWKKIVEDLKEKSAEAEIKSRMEPLSELIASTLTHLHSVFEIQVFLPVCWGLWDRFGKEVLYALEMSKENRSWYQGSRVALSVVDGVFSSKVQMLVGNAIEESEVKPPKSVLEAHSVLSKDLVSFK